MNQVELKQRTKQFATRVMRLCSALPNTREGRVVADQLLRCGTSVGANYRAVCRSRSRAEFISKVNVVLEEADEACYWLELVAERELLPPRRLAPLVKEADELVAIFVATLRTSKGLS